MSYPDKWNHIHKVATESELVMDQARLLAEHHIEALSVQKDEAVKAGNYVEAAQLRDRRDKLKKFHKPAATCPKEVNIADLMGYNPKSKFKKAFIIPDQNPSPTNKFRGISPQLMYEADIVITESGEIIKSRYTEIPSKGGPVQSDYVEKALAKLSGDLNYDNVAEAKKILKDLLK